MRKKTPNVLEDLLFHTVDPQSDAEPEQPDRDHCVPIHPRRWRQLQRHADQQGMPLQEVVDRALELYFAADSPADSPASSG